MSYFITIQYPYQYLTITLSDNTTMVETQTISKFQAISLLIPTLKTMLDNHNLTLADIACIGINTGPGPFNTLRSIIATANGISFAKQIPLVGCNGLDLMLQETNNHNTVVILDAFGSDVYFAIKASDYAPASAKSYGGHGKASTDTTGTSGYNSIENLMTELNQSANTTITFIGNGAIKHQEYIVNNFAGSAKFVEDCLFASPQSLVNATYSKFSQGQTEKEIFPLYFASPVVKN
jgi:tRNA threonylcarbamoyl adenosine modification protein YeaZ